MLQKVEIGPTGFYNPEEDENKEIYQSNVDVNIFFLNI